MDKFNFSKLQNGSDIRGVALPGFNNEEVNLTPSVIKSITSAFAVWLCNHTKNNADQLKIAVGHDSRLSGPDIKKIFELRLRQLGVEVMDVGMATTPAMFMSTVFPEFDCDAAVMITASHLPKNRNGFKFFTKDGGFDKSNIKEMLSVAQGLYRTRKIEDDEIVPHEVIGTIEKLDLMEKYSHHLKQLILDNTESEKPLQGLHIVVDAGNGSGGFYAKDVLEPLGADISGSQFLEPDGAFPNHIPNPENKEAMESIKSAVKENKADLGLIFDTDVDRVSAVDSKGNDISRNGIIALASALIYEEHPGATVVTDSITSTGLNEYLEKDLGLVHHRFKRGYKNVINEAIRLNKEGVDAQLAIETSGHAAYKENSFLDDGAYLATKIVIKASQLKSEGQAIDKLLLDLKAAKEIEEFRFDIKLDNYGPYGDKVLNDLEKWAQNSDGFTVVKPNYEGVRINFPKDAGDGWLLLRKSLHDPVMPMNIESEQAGGIKKIGNNVLRFLNQYNDLDTEGLEKYCK